MSKSVAEAMTGNPTAVAPHASAADAARIMLEEDVGSVPVVEDGYLLGIVTDRDITLRVVAAGRDPRTTRIEEIATPEPHYASPAESVDDAYERMTVWQIRRLPVVENDRLVGMLAQADLVHELKDNKSRPTRRRDLPTRAATIPIRPARSRAQLVRSSRDY
jgi:CBS domain-containing protein